MADKKISALTAATIPLAGTEVLPIVQSGATVKVSVDNLTAGKPVSMTNLNFTGIGSRITGDTANATVTNRLALQDSTTNAQTIFSVFPNGTATTSQVQLYNSSSGTNYTRFNLTSFATSVALGQTISGTGTYLPMTFSTSASEAMRLDTSGNLGIGTSSPQNRLNVYGSGTGGAAQTTLLLSHLDGGSGSQSIRLGSYQSGASVIGGAYLRALYNYASSTATSLAFVIDNGTSAAEAMRIASDGNVGIGVVPSATGGKIQVMGAINTASAQFSGNANGMSVLNQTGLTVYTNLSGGSTDTTLVAGGAAGTYMAFGIHNATSYSERMRIDASGNVGIGTSSGNTKFTVQGAAAYGIARFTTSDYSDGVSGSGILINTGATTGNTFTSINAYQAGFASSNNLILQNTGGNVGIGTSSPGAKLDVQGSVGTSSPLLVLKNTSTASASNIAQTQFFTGNTFGGLEQVASITGFNPNAGVNNGGALYFSTSANGTATTPTERMRIDSSGNLLVGRTSAIAKLSLQGNGATDPVFYVLGDTAGDVGNGAVRISKFDNDTTTSQIFVQFLVNNTSTGSGQINANGASQAAFGSFSDSRLKENIVDLPSQLENIMALRPVEFDYIQSEGGGHQIGFIAQEMKEVYSDAVGERSDGMLTVTGWNKTEAILVKAIQELKAEFDAYKLSHP
jgi:hypothetical protein